MDLNILGYNILSNIFLSPFQFFLTLSGILFQCSQLTSCFKSALTSLFSFLTELFSYNKLVSSANW